MADQGLSNLPANTVAGNLAVCVRDGSTVASVRDLTNANPLDVALVDATGAQIDPRDLAKSWKTAAISVGAAGDNTIVSAVATKRIKAYVVKFGSTGTVSAKWKDGAGTDLEGAMDFQAREGYTEAVTPPAFLFATSPGNALVLNLSLAVPVRGRVSYWDDDTS